LTPIPTAKTLQLHSSLHKALSSIIIQMRTERIGLRKYLHQRKVPDITDDQCGCGHGSQTVKHILLACSLFNDLRTRTWTKEDRIRARRDLREILSKPALARRAAKFMISTGLLGQFGAVLTDEITQGEH
jgi:hypothetical protein